MAEQKDQNIIDDGRITEIDGNSVEDIKRRLSALRDRRSPREANWQQIAELVIPGREIKDKNDNGKTVGTYIYSTRAPEANKIWSAGLQGSTVPAQQKWLKTRLPYMDLDSDADVKLWLDMVDKILEHDINASNFYAEINPFLEDGGAFGTSYMFLEDVVADGKVACKTEHWHKMYIAEDRYGKVDTVYMEYILTTLQAVEKFGKENLSAKIQQSYETGRYDTQYTFYSIVQPRLNRDEKKIDAKNMPFFGAEYEEGSDYFLEEKGFRKMPWIVWRVEKQTDEEYGRGPADEALPAIVSANNMAKDTMRISQINADPPVSIAGEWNGKVRTTPGAKNYAAAGNAQVAPIITGQRYDVSLAAQEREEAAIDRIYNTEFWTFLSRSEVQKTATEINAVQGERAVLLGPLVGRINSEVLDPLIDRFFDIAMAAGRIPPPPRIVLENLNGAQLEIDYLGPLAQLQKQATRNRAINQALGSLIPLAEVFPQMLDRINPDALAKEILEVSGAPATVQNDDAQVAQIQAQRAEAQAQAMAAQQAQEATAPIDLAKKPEEGSPLALVNEQQEAG